MRTGSKKIVCNGGPGSGPQAGVSGGYGDTKFGLNHTKPGTTEDQVLAAFKEHEAAGGKLESIQDTKAALAKHNLGKTESNPNPYKRGDSTYSRRAKTLQRQNKRI